MEFYLGLDTPFEKDFDVLWSALTKAYKNLQSPSEAVVIGLSGGSTPMELYALLAKALMKPEHAALKTAITWVLIDERQVPETDPESNLGQIKKVLFEPAQIAKEKILAFNSNLDPKEACLQMSSALKKMQQTRQESFFDILILGAGTDGHIASLFTPQDREAIQTAPEGSTAMVLETHAKGYPTEARWSLRFELLLQSQMVMLLLKGQPKKAMWEQLQTKPIPKPLQDSALATFLEAIDQI